MGVYVSEEEVFSIEDQEVCVLRIIGFEEELVAFPKMGIVPPRAFKALKIYIDEENGAPLKRHYWIDSKRHIAALLPKLKEPGGVPRRYRIKKFGFPPKSTYTVEVA